MKDRNLDINRREFLQRLGLGTASALSLMALGPLGAFAGTPLHSTSRRDDKLLANEQGESLMTCRRMAREKRSRCWASA